MSARKNNAGVLMMQQAESGLTKDNLRAFRELYRILLDPKLEDYQSRGTRFKLGGCGGGGGGVYTGDKCRGSKWIVPKIKKWQLCSGGK